MLISAFLTVFAFVVAASAQNSIVVQFFEQGTQAAENAQYEKAMKIYQKALLHTENYETDNLLSARIHHNIGVCLYQLNRHDEAVAEFTKSINLSRGNYQKSYYALGMAQVELKNEDEALKAFRQAVKLRKSDGEAWFDLASVLIAGKDFDAAEKALQKAVKHKSVASAQAHNNLGVILALKGDFAGAENEFNTALSEPGGELTEASSNLRICREYKQTLNQKLTADFKFSDLTNTRRHL